MAERKVLFQGAHASLVIANSSSIADNHRNPRRSELKSIVAGKHVSLNVARSATTPTDDASQPHASPQVMCTAAALDALIPLDERHHHSLWEGEAVSGGRHADPCPVGAETSAARVNATPLELPGDTAVVWAALRALAAPAPGVSGPPDGNCTCGCVRVLWELLATADGMPPGSMASVVADPTLLDPDTSPSLPRSARHSGLPAAAFAGGGGGGVQVVGPTTLSTRCPISRAPLKLPAVLCGCRHEQPFDALVALHAAITEHRTRAAEQRPSLLLTPYEQQPQQYAGSGNFVSDYSPGGGGVIVGGGAADGSTLITPSTLAVACPVCGAVASALALRVSPPLTEALRQLGPSYETIRVPPCTGEPGAAGAGGHLLWDAARIDMGVLVAAAAHGGSQPRHSVASVGSSSSESELPLSGF